MQSEITVRMLRSKLAEFTDRGNAPCCYWGTWADDWAPVAALVALAYEAANGEPMSADAAAAIVVNDSEGTRCAWAVGYAWDRASRGVRMMLDLPEGWRDRIEE